jgi:hypothetical protein
LERRSFVLKGFIGVMVFVVLCLAMSVVVLLTTLVEITRTQLPFGQAEVAEWMLGSGSEGPGGYSSAAGVGVGWDGYSGPGSDPSGLPFDFKAPLNCLFHDPNYMDHCGVDFPVAEGTTVLTTMNGKVVWAGENGPWGNLVVVENNGFQTYYAHLSQISVAEGQVLARGESVGLSGTTGNSTGPHLHYGIKKKTETGQVWLDPIDFFAGAEYTKVPCPSE